MHNAPHASASLLRLRVRYFIPFIGVHRRSGEQVSGTSYLAILHRERANKVFGKHFARLLERFHIAVLYVLIATARLPPRQWGATHRHHLYPVILVSLETYGFLSLTKSFIPSMIWLGLILLLQYFILNCLISIFTYVHFLYALFIMVMFYLRINLKLKLLFIPSFQKSYYRNFSFMAGFVDALRPEKFCGEHFKRWQTRVILWLSSMNVLWVSKGKPEGPLTPEQEKAFTEANTLFVGAVIGTIVDRLQDVYLHRTDAKKLWDALEADYGGTDASAELYIMEQYHDYKMTDGKSVVEQAHEIQCMAKELEHLKINLPDKFVAGGIIAKLSPSWWDFATTLKHKRMEISVSNLIASLDVEEKARAKDGRSKAAEVQTSANMV
jgi:hypothetical protein